MSNSPRLEACYFDNTDRGEIYTRLARVLEYTAHKHCSDWDISVEHLDPPNYTSAMGNASHVWNTQKLQHWVRRALACPDGAQVLLIDGDMMILKPLDEVWSFDFDLAYTIRHATRLPFNGGAVFLRISPAVRSFLGAWWETNLRFLGDAMAHRPYRMKYAGINQSSFGCMLERRAEGLKVKKLPCAEWNVCEWEKFYDPAVARIVHIKSGLRRALFNIRPAPRMGSKIGQIIQLWRKQEKEAGRWRNRRAKTSVSSATEATRSTSAGA